VKTPVGYIPEISSIDRPSSVTESDMKELLSFNKTGWKEEVKLIREHYSVFKDRLPSELKEQLDRLEKELS